MDEIEVVSEYVPTEKQKIFHSSPAKYKVIPGGLGSGKTRMAVEEVGLLLAENDGIVGYAMRKTMPSLRDSTLHELKKYIDPQFAPYNHKTEQFNCMNQSQLRCRGLDEPHKMKGPEPAFILLDEADEFTFEDFLTLKARVRQKNRKPGGKPYPLHLILIFNPDKVDDAHWIYKQFVENGKEYDKDGGLLHLKFTTFDNLINLEPNYIQQASLGLTKEQIDSLIYGEYARVAKGDAVYGRIIKEFHFKKWIYTPDLGLSRSWDFGYNRPACMFFLKDRYNRKNVDWEVLGEKEDLDTFARRILAVTSQRYGTNKVCLDYCDPHGFDKSDKGKTSAEILQDLGIFPQGERGMRAYVEPGIQVVRKQLSTLIEGDPELTINPECTITKAALGGKYARDVETGEPVKDGFYDHLMDCLRNQCFMDKSNHAVKEAIVARSRRLSQKSYSPITGYG